MKLGALNHSFNLGQFQPIRDVFQSEHLQKEFPNLTLISVLVHKPTKIDREHK